MLLYRLNQNILFHLCTAFCKLHQTILFPQHFSAGKKTFNCKYVVNTSRILELSFLPKSLIYIHHWGSTHFWSSWWIILYCIIDTGNHMNYTEYFKQVLTNSHSQLNLFRCNNNPAMIVFLLLFVNIPLSDGWLNVLFLYILSEFTGLIMWNRQNITCDRETLKNNKYVQKFDQVFVWQEWKLYMMTSWPNFILQQQQLESECFIDILFIKSNILTGQTLSKFEETNNWSNFKSLDQDKECIIEERK